MPQLSGQPRERAGEAVCASERDLKRIIDTIPGLVWSARPDGSADFLNQHYLDFIGFSAEQALGWGWAAAVHADDLDRLIATWRRITADHSSGEAEARLRRNDGQFRWFLVRASPLRDERGAVVGWYGVNTDIEEIKRAELELKRAHDSFADAQRLSHEALSNARAELLHVARVATLSTLTASIAHEVNQPLSGIITNAGTCIRMLDAEPPNIPGARQTASRAVRDGHRVSAVMTRLRTLFSKKEFLLESLDLNDVIREVMAMSSAECQRHRIVVAVELAEGLPRVAGDRVQLQQVLFNLIRNALDAMLDVQDRPRQLLIRTEREGGDHVRATVRDAGVGIDAQAFSKIFDAFYTTKKGGMGIGLSISRAIVERHQGRLSVAANDGPGATFLLSIPRQAGGALEPP
ncbi:MAG TPA: ATP-binding protein [Polyangiaceae bacterium]|nr:ATP-binding protein [Polyangiaceae bacterium]